MRNRVKRIGQYFLSVSFLFLLSACGTRVGSGLTGGVTIRSEAFTTSFLAVPFFSAPPLSALRFCVRKIKLEKEDGSHAQKDGKEDIEIEIGAIDLTDGAEKTWGSPELPVGFTASRIKIKLAKDPDLCGFNHSVKFNEFESDEDIELRFRFNSATEFSAGSVLRLGIQGIVSALKAADDSNDLTNDTLKEYAEETEETCEKD